MVPRSVARCVEEKRDGTETALETMRWAQLAWGTKVSRRVSSNASMPRKRRVKERQNPEMLVEGKGVDCGRKGQGTPVKSTPDDGRFFDKPTI